MKKIYLLLFALIATLSAQATRVLFLEGNNNIGDNHYVVINNSSSAYSTLNLGGNKNFWVYAQSTSFSTVQLASNTSKGWTTNSISVSSDITGLYVEGGTDGKGLKAYGASPKFRGQWTSETWTEIAADTYVSGTRYKTATQTMISKGSADFGFFIGNSNDYWNGYNNQTLSSSNTTASFNQFTGMNNNSHINLPAGTQYHLEIDYSTMNIYLVVETPDPTITLANASGSATSSTSASLTWGAITSENTNTTPTYQVVFTCTTNSAFTTTVNSASANGGSTTVTGLLPNNTYNFSAVAKMTVGGKTYTSDAKTFSVKTPNKTLADPTIEFVTNTNSGRKAKYFKAKVNHSQSTGITKYYAILPKSDTSTPDFDKFKKYSDEFQIPGECYVWAYAKESDGTTSNRVFAGHEKSENFDWEETKDNERLDAFKVKLKLSMGDLIGETGYESGKRRPMLEAEIGGKEYMDYGDSETSPFSWSKYFDVEAFENEVASSDQVNCDHTPTPGYTDIQQNTSTMHVCRNYNPAYYRMYVHSDKAPDPAGSNSVYRKPAGKRNVMAYADDAPDAENWNYDVNAGNVDPFATARVAYTAYVDPSQQIGSETPTGVEDIVAPEAGSEVDADAPVYYYNLQGVQVANPEHGIYIRVQGKTVTKVLVK